VQVCKFHPGVPIFHEGLKYWSCCQKKTTEFDVFLKQEGCQIGSHLWIKPKENTTDGQGSEIIKCRMDWHQDGTHMILVIYAGGKKFDPKRSFVKANPVKLDVELCFPEQNGYYREDWVLAGVSNNGAELTVLISTKRERL
jgi:cysteine/histidine-rich domain-containing protein 1